MRTIGLMTSFDGLRAVAVLIILACHMSPTRAAAEPRWPKGASAASTSSSS